MKIILTDLDEVVFNWRDDFESWIRTVKNMNPATSVQECNNLEEWLGIPYKQTHELIYEFNHNFNRFSDLKPYAQAAKNLPILHAAGHKFVAITAASWDEPTFHARWSNIQRYFPNMFVGLHLTNLSGTKKPYLDMYRPTYWVDDKPKHAHDGFLSGHRAFMIEYQYNKNADVQGVKRVKNWDEITECILSNYGEGCEYPGWVA